MLQARVGNTDAIEYVLWHSIRPHRNQDSLPSRGAAKRWNHQPAYSLYQMHKSAYAITLYMYCGVTEHRIRVRYAKHSTRYQPLF